MHSTIQAWKRLRSMNVDANGLQNISYCEKQDVEQCEQYAPTG